MVEMMATGVVQSLVSDQQSSAWNTQVGNHEDTHNPYSYGKNFRIFVQITSFYFSQAFVITGSLAFPLATQVDKLIFIETFKVSIVDKDRVS